jgi:lysozyme
MNRHMSSAGIQHLKEFEGVELRAYQDVGGVWTIGFGHTRNVKAGDRITLAQAEELLRIDLKTFERCVNRLVTVAIHQLQFDALVSFAYNIGCGALERSTLLSMLNSGDHSGAAEQLLRWNKVQGKVVRGLTRRRESERLMFLEGRLKLLEEQT